jgi:hypothetical protein
VRTLNPVLHELACALKLVGVRDRLRCPHCKAVGTWKPHGGWIDTRDLRHVRRWICKWCGYYLGPEPEARWARPNLEDGAWQLITPDNAHKLSDTPRQVVADTLGEGVSPWRG